MSNDVKFIVCPTCGQFIYSIGGITIVCSKCNEVIVLYKPNI